MILPIIEAFVSIRFEIFGFVFSTFCVNAIFLVILTTLLYWQYYKSQRIEYENLERLD